MEILANHIASTNNNPHQPSQVTTLTREGRQETPPMGLGGLITGYLKKLSESVLDVAALPFAGAGGLFNATASQSLKNIHRKKVGEQASRYVNILSK